VGGGGRGPGDSDPGDGDPNGGLAPTLALLLAGSALATGFLVFARRRRRRREPPENDGATATSGGPARQPEPAVVAASWARPASPQPLRPATAAAGEPAPDPVLTGVVAQILPTEAHMPRWRRPSLKEARYQSERAPAPVARHLAFSAAAAPGVERATIRYDLVPLLDQPDEVTGIPIGELRAGDEVDVIGRRAVWVEVRTPNGRAGWLHRTTLEVVRETPLSSPEPAPEVVAEPGTTDTTAADAPDPRALDQLLAAIVAERRAAAIAIAAAAAEATTGAESAADEATRTAPKRPAKSPRGSTNRAAQGPAAG
jgi:hypothetical protein